MKTAEEFVPYGPEWEKNLMTTNKKFLIDMVRRNAQRANELETQLADLREGSVIALNSNQRKGERIKELEAQLKVKNEALSLAIKKVQWFAYNTKPNPEVYCGAQWFTKLSDTKELFKALESSPTEQPEAQKCKMCKGSGYVNIDCANVKCGACDGEGVIEQQNQPQPEKAQEEQSFRKNCYIGSKIGCYCTTECNYRKLNG